MTNSSSFNPIKTPTNTAGERTTTNFKPLMDHTITDWAPATDYFVNQTVYHPETQSTYICIADIEGDAANVTPNLNTGNWAVFATNTDAITGTPLTTEGDILVRDSGVSRRLPIGRNGQVLTVDSAGRFLWASGEQNDPRSSLAVNIVSGGSVAERYALREDASTSTYYYNDISLGYAETNINRTAGMGFRASFAAVGGSPWKLALSNSAMDPVINRPNTSLFNDPSRSEVNLGGSGYIVNGRFYRHLGANAYGGLFNPHRLFSGNQGSATVNAFTDDYSSSTEWEAVSLLSSGLTLNHHAESLEWRIFNEVDAPNNRNLHVIDYIETKTSYFVFLCAPADDIDNVNARTLWAIGGVGRRSADRSGIGATNYTNPAGSNSNAVDGAPLARRFFNPAGIGYEITTLRQISAPGPYRRLFLLDPDNQYSTGMWFIPVDSLAANSDFLVKTTEGEWQRWNIATGTSDANDATTTATQVYPNSVTNRDELSVTSQVRQPYQASYVPWKGEAGSNFTATVEIGAGSNFPPDLDIFLRVNAYKSDDNVVTVATHGRPGLFHTNGRLTIPAGRVIKQIKAFQWWDGRGDTRGVSEHSRHPTSLTIFVVDTEGDVYMAGANTMATNSTTDVSQEAKYDSSQDNVFNATSTDTTSFPGLPGTGNTVGMTKLSGPWDGNAERIETYCTVASSAITMQSNATLATTNSVNPVYESLIFNVVYIHTSSSVYEHVTTVENASSTLDAQPSENSDLFNMFTSSNSTPSMAANIFSLWTYREALETAKLSIGNIDRRWNRLDIPKGVIDRIFLACGGHLKTRLMMINDFGEVFEGRPYLFNRDLDNFQNPDLRESNKALIDTYASDPNWVTQLENAGSGSSAQRRNNALPGVNNNRWVNIVNAVDF